MNVGNKEFYLENMLLMLPRRIREEIKYVARSYKRGIFDISEIHLRTMGVSALRLSTRTVILKVRLTASEMAQTVEKITEGSFYTHRDTVTRGYVSLPGGIRVGICGSARHAEGKTLITAISSLCIRIPTGRCDFKDELYKLYKAFGTSMLIYSAPGGGKTTALRALARALGTGETSRTVIIDERSEFDRAEYLNCRVDILDGYEKREALAIAVRSMAAEVVLIDELTEELWDCMRSGVRTVATIHASSVSELLSKPRLKPLLDGGVFPYVVGIFRENGKYKLLPSQLKTEGAYA